MTNLYLHLHENREGNASLNTPFVPTQVDLSGGIENIDFTDNPFGDSKYPKSSYQQSSPDFIRPERTPTVFKNTINQFNNTMGYSALLAAKKKFKLLFSAVGYNCRKIVRTSKQIKPGTEKNILST